MNEDSTERLLPENTRHLLEITPGRHRLCNPLHPFAQKFLSMIA